MTAPRHRGWALQTTSLPRNVFGVFYGLLMCTGAILSMSSGARHLWAYAFFLAFGTWITAGAATAVVTLLRHPQLRGADLPLRPVSRRAVQRRTLTLIVVAAATVSSGAVWWLTDDWTPWAIIFGVGALLTVGAYFDRYLLLNRARNEALLASTRPTSPETPTSSSRALSRPPDDTAVDG